MASVKENILTALQLFWKDKVKPEIEASSDRTMLKAYPIGSIYMSVNNVNPSTIFGGTWERWGNGRVPVGVQENASYFNTVEKMGGDVHVGLHEHKLDIQNTDISHSHASGNGDYFVTANGTVHDEQANKSMAGSGGDYPYIEAESGDNWKQTQYTATWSQSHKHYGYTAGFEDSYAQGHAENLQPYITCYMWKRTA